MLFEIFEAVGVTGPAYTLVEFAFLGLAAAGVASLYERFTSKK